MPLKQQLYSQNQGSDIPVPQPQLRCASYYKRYVAFALDSVIIMIVVLPLLIETPVFLSTHWATWYGYRGVSVAVRFLLVIVPALVYFIAITNKYQTTIGKKILGLKVVSVDGTRLPLRKVILREIASIPFGLGIKYMNGGGLGRSDSKSQTLSDKISGSVVISEREISNLGKVALFVIYVTLWLYFGFITLLLGGLILG